MGRLFYKPENAWVGDLIPYYEKQGFTNDGLSESQYAGEVCYNLGWENENLN